MTGAARRAAFPFQTGNCFQAPNPVRLQAPNPVRLYVDVVFPGVPLSRTWGMQAVTALFPRAKTQARAQVELSARVPMSSEEDMLRMDLERFLLGRSPPFTHICAHTISAA
jgi:hypothetical protein